MNVEDGRDYEAQTGDVGICFGCGAKQTIDGAGILVLLSKEMESVLDFKTKLMLDRAAKTWHKQYMRAS